MFQVHHTTLHSLSLLSIMYTKRLGLEIYISSPCTLYSQLTHHYILIEMDGSNKQQLFGIQELYSPGPDADIE